MCICAIITELSHARKKYIHARVQSLIHSLMHTETDCGTFCLGFPKKNYSVFWPVDKRFRSATGVRAAFAKAVPNAMVKSAAAVCGEIAQDHADALGGKLHD